MLAQRAERGADRADADGGPRPGRVRGGRHAGLGLRAAVERVAAARAGHEHDCRGGVRRINITHVGIPDTNLNQLSVGTARAWARRFSIACRIPTSASFRARRRWAIRRSRAAQLLKPYPQYTSVSLYRNNVGTTRYQGLELSVRQRLAARADVLGGLHSLQADGRRLVRFDASILTGPIAKLSGSGQFQPIARARLLDRRHPAHLRFFGRLGSSRRHGPRPSADGILGAIANDWTMTSFVTLQSGVPVAVTQVTNFNAFAGSACSGRTWSATRRCRPTSGRPVIGSIPRPSSVAPQFTLGSASRNPVRGPSYRDVDLALMRRIPLGANHAIEVRAEVFNLLNTTNFGAPAAVAGAANFGTITTALDPRVVQLALKFVF